MHKINILIGICFLFSQILPAQCSMCRAVAESSQNHGSSIANGLNTGILYLMAFPYILLLCGLIFIYFRNKKIN